MPNVLMTHWTQQFSTTGEQAFLGITMMLVGVSLVLIILISISILVSLMSKLLHNRKNGSGSTGTPAGPATSDSSKAGSSAGLQETAASETGSHDPAVVAAIAAAIHSWFSSDGKAESSTAGFRIRRIRRV